MAHLKLFFPGVSSSNGLSNLLLPHLALSQFLCHPEENLNEQRIKAETAPKATAVAPKEQWRHFHKGLACGFPQTRQKIQTLTCIADMETSDYWSGPSDKDSCFVHALQLGKEDCSVSDIETVQSIVVGQSRKWSSDEGETESCLCQSQVINLA